MAGAPNLGPQRYIKFEDGSSARMSGTEIQRMRAKNKKLRAQFDNRTVQQKLLDATYRKRGY